MILSRKCCAPKIRKNFVAECMLLFQLDNKLVDIDVQALAKTYKHPCCVRSQLCCCRTQIFAWLRKWASICSYARLTINMRLFFCVYTRIPTDTYYILKAYLSTVFSMDVELFSILVCELFISDPFAYVTYIPLSFNH